MAIDDALYQKLLVRFAQMPKQLRCPACDDHHWELRSMEETFGGSPGTVPPIVTIMCQCCGHLSFFDSKGLGLTS
jgi:RNase P subunit RPR2